MRLVTAVLLACFLITLGASAAEPIALFNGKDMSGWYGYVKGKGK
jgi:hypothetical protein